ncbi:hypothetical protein ACFE04_026259 [Oxalis oulophora]
MGAIEKTFVPIVTFLLFHVFLLSKHGIVEGVAVVPRFDVTSEVLLKYMQFDGGKIIGGNYKLKVPALYGFGDSYIDSGNTKVLNHMKVELPYGMDFNTSYSNYGRYTNGRTMIDFLAQAVGLPFPSTCLAMSEEKKESTKTGINFASAGGGILPTTVLPGHKIMNLGDQVDKFESVLESLKSQFKSKKKFNKYMKKSLFFINIGNNDYGFTYAMIYSRSKNFSEDTFAASLVKELTKQLQRLYNFGARKFLVNNAIPMGCTPFAISKHNKTIDIELNEAISLYNENLEVGLSKLKRALKGFKYSVGDINMAMMDAIEDPSKYGVIDPLKPCCFNCTAKSVCNNPKEHMFFDHSHVSEVTHYMIMRRFFTESSFCTPTPIAKLINA